MSNYFISPDDKYAGRVADEIAAIAKKTPDQIISPRGEFQGKGYLWGYTTAQRWIDGLALVINKTQPL